MAGACCPFGSALPGALDVAMNNAWWFVLLLLAVAAVLLLLSLRERKKSGLPGARVVYADSDLWQRVPETLLDAQLGIVGKPDYVMKTRQGDLIPVEVKTGNTPEAPYDSHRLQLMAYGLLIRSNYGKTPLYGLLHYPEKDFRVDFTPALEAHFLNTLENIRRMERERQTPARSHAMSARCRGCGYRGICDEKLG
jgi:CRISPR-associated exonuclease Cas4